MVAANVPSHSATEVVYIPLFRHNLDHPNKGVAIYHSVVYDTLTPANTKHLYNIYTKTLGRRCINVIQMCCVFWDGGGGVFLLLIISLFASASITLQLSQF